jgi:hypothetical protein
MGCGTLPPASVAEGVGFEPTELSLNGFQDRRLKPLGHPSPASIKEGHQAVVDAIRTNNMYPPTVFAGPIASAIEGLFKEGGNLSAELFFDDKELFFKEAEAAEEESDDDVEEDVAVDELLEDDDIDDGLEDDNVLKGLKSKIKKTEDDSENIEDVT